MNRTQLTAIAKSEIANILRHLPPDIATLARDIPVFLEPLPSPEHLRDGIAPDTLGLFDGTPYNEELTDPQPMPPQIFLFLDNLWDYAEEDSATFRDEVRLTFLHELGHYLGWDEDDMEAHELD